MATETQNQSPRRLSGDASLFDRLPLHIEEDILARQPARSLLLRFQFVSKWWKSIIWSPSFRKVHANVFPDSCKGTFFMCCSKPDESTKFCLARLESDISLDKHESEEDVIRLGTVYKGSFVGARPYCSCNGVVLLVRTAGFGKYSYILLNPVSGMYGEIACDYDVGFGNECVYGLSFDRELDDFKIVTVCGGKYFTYSCKSDTWSPMKEFIYDQVYNFFGISMNGKFYMVFGSENKHERYILHFNNGDDTFSMLPKLKGMSGRGMAMSESLEGNLCVWACDLLDMMMVVDYNNFLKLEGEDWIESNLDDAGLKRVHGFIIPSKEHYTYENGVFIHWFRRCRPWLLDIDYKMDVLSAPKGWEYPTYIFCAETLFFPSGIQGKVGNWDLTNEHKDDQELDGYDYGFEDD